MAKAKIIETERLTLKPVNLEDELMLYPLGVNELNYPHNHQFKAKE